MPESDLPASEVAARVREALTSGDASLTRCVPLIANFASSCSQASVNELDELLQEILLSSIDREDMSQIGGFIAILHALLPTLPPVSVVTSWFDLLLRSSFRTPRLPRNCVSQAREIILHGLSDVNNPKSANFRRMIMDLYLYDVFNENSKEDALEQVALGAAEQERQRLWKINLEETLLADALRQPRGFFVQLNDSFQAPRHRLQLAVLLSQLARQPHLSVAHFCNSSLFDSILWSLALDYSTTVVSVCISVLIMMLPQMAFEIPLRLNENLPRLLSILSRVICWKERSVASRVIGATEPGDTSVASLPTSSAPRMELAPEISWTCLESSFDSAAESPPDARLYFQFMYGLWPTCTLAFLRRPISYLEASGLQSPFTVRWDEAIDVDELHSRVKPILRSHIIHPSIILLDSSAEIQDCRRWSANGMDVAALVSQCISLDVQNAAAALPGRHRSAQNVTSFGMATPTKGLALETPIASKSSLAPAAVMTSLGSDATAPQSSSSHLQELIANHVVLNTSTIGIEVSELQDNTNHGTEILQFSPRLRYHSRLVDEAGSPTHPSTPVSPPLRYGSPPAMTPSLPTTPPAGPSPRFRFKALVAFGGDQNETNALEVVSSLQREVLLLRNELNFELWLKKQHLSHMGKLHRDRIIARGEEAERQGLHNKLKQKTKLLDQALEDLKTLKVESASAKMKQNEWVESLQRKLAKYREEKKSWASEATELRSESIEAKKMVAKQRLLMDEVETERFKLCHQIDSVMPKVEKIREYEKQIEEMSKRQLMWDDSTEMREYRKNKAEMDATRAKVVEMRMMIESLEAANQSLEEMNSQQRKTIYALERRASTSPVSTNRNSRAFSGSQSMTNVVPHERYITLENEYLEVKGQKRELEDKVEELEVMVEHLRRELHRTGRRGSVNNPRSALPGMGTIPGPFGL